MTAGAALHDTISVAVVRLSIELIAILAHGLQIAGLNGFLTSATARGTPLPVAPQKLQRNRGLIGLADASRIMTPPRREEERAAMICHA